MSLCFVATRKWSQLAVNGSVPGARDGHSACVIGEKMYVFGGYEEDVDKFSNEVHALDFPTLTWSLLRCTVSVQQRTLFLTWINFNPSMDTEFISIMKCGMKLLIRQQIVTVDWISNSLPHFTGSVIQEAWQDCYWGSMSRNTFIQLPLTLFFSFSISIIQISQVSFCECTQPMRDDVTV